ncbi:hypothetical protein D9M68_786980 [compost metagenome]
MVQTLPDGGKQQHRRACFVGFGPVATDGLQALPERLGHHDHAGTTTKRPVVHAAVIALGEIARVPQTHIHLFRLERAAGDAALEKRLKQFGKQGDDVKAHGGYCHPPAPLRGFPLRGTAPFDRQSRIFGAR